MNVRKRGLALLMCICMIFTLLPFSVFAEDPVDDGHAKIGDQDYDSLDAALAAAKDNDTIYLGAGEYSLSTATTQGQKPYEGKNFTFVGAGAEKTKWIIKRTENNLPGDGPCDYSFDSSNSITFEGMTLISGRYSDGVKTGVKTDNYQGFVRINNITLKDCIFNGRADYWGYQTTTFDNVIFNAPGTEASGIYGEDYSLWTWTGRSYTFNKCTFNASGKIINAFREASDGTEENPIVLNFNNCTVISSKPNKSVLNIKDNNNYFTVNINGTNSITGLKPDTHTCSRMFQVQGWADDYNLCGGKGNGKRCLATVNIDDTPVWKDGKMVSHAIDTDNDKYTDGYKDNAFTVEKNGNTVTKTCQYCGWTESYTKQDWNINVSKTATNLKKDANGDYKTNVTLSVPSVEESLASDVVFVLDKSTSTTLEEQAIAMLNDLKAQTEKTGAKVKVGVVIFNKEANVTELTDLATGYDIIVDAIRKEIKSGTNTHAGMLAGKQLLDGDDSVAPNRKYLIFVSDGISYMYDEDGKIVPYYWMNDRSPYYSADPYSWSFKYKNNNPPENWSDWVKQIGSIIEKEENENVTPISYTEHKAAVDNKTVDPTNYKNVSDLTADQYTTSVDRALYYTYQTYAAAQAEGYNCYAVVNENEKEKPSEYPWGPAFMRYLAGGEKVDFSKIQNDILYAVDKGSYVKDVIGDKFELFDLKPDHNGFSSLKLYVGNKELTNRFILANVENGDFTVYYFADNFDTNTLLNAETNSVDEDKLEQSYRFKVDYNVEQKLFTWTFGEAVSNFAPVQLSYTLKLTTPETRPGTYGQLDLNGNGYIEDKDGKDTRTEVVPGEALYTNKSATLTPVDSNGHEGVNKYFPKPSVEYTVRNPYRPPVNPGIGDEIIVEITGNSDSVVYDGTEHSVKDYTVKISDPRYTEADFTFTGKAEASGVNAGTYEMGLKAEQFKNTNARFTNVKFVIKADGVLTITPKELIITAGSKTEYGPTPVTCDEWTVSGLAAGDKVESVKITGIQSVPGSSPNVPSDAVIKNAKGEDVTKNYAIKYVNGTLTMLEVLNKEDHFNYIIGTPEGLSLPTANVTRAEVATIFFRLMTDDARAKFDSLDNNFSDVAKGQWYNRAISTLANAGIIKGDPAGTYRPGDPITRAEMATIIARFGDFKEGGKTFNDISGHWAQKYIELAASNGWINGNPDGTFKPNNNITRAETVAMINRVLDRQTKDVSDLLPVSQMTNWSDNANTAAWYYRDMQEATNNHKAERVGNSEYEKWTEKLPDIDWASYQI